jgi:thymidylate synthase (FAD)
MLAENGHGSTLEHVSFTFAVEGVSRSLLAQLTRHRIASYSVQSQRYVPLKSFDSVIPREIENDPEALAAYQAAMAAAGEAYNKLTDILQAKHRKRLEAEGMDTKTARQKAQKMAIEDARSVLPNSCETKLLMTMNARSLMNFFAHRCCSRAQTEIRELADELLRLVKGAAPLLFAKAGPSCLRGKCPEGNLSCGLAAEMRAKYGG